MKNIIAIYKPKGPTSHDIVDAVRDVTGERKVGHAGTLDPLATGVLVVGITRKGTKQLGQLSKKDKEYIATVKLGETSTTGDAEGLLASKQEKKEIRNEKKVTRQEVEGVLQHFMGTIEQTPPVYSAIKVRGEAAHRRIRRGEKVELEPREVRIDEIELLEYSWPILKLRVVTGPGVYIRALSRDVGETLGTGGYLAALERTRVGTYTKANALTLEEFKKQWNYLRG